LPDGFERIGYDADTQRYTFRDARDGSLWEGGEGAEYGTLHRSMWSRAYQPGYLLTFLAVGQSSVTNNEHDQDIQVCFW
jgi:hypothetical protein